MEYTKSEIREATKRIKHELEQIEDWLPSVPNNWMGWVMITSSLEALKYVLNPLKTHIIDNDDFDIAIEINNLISPVWDDYFGRVSSKELEAHSATWEVYDLIKDLRDWIGEYEEKHHKQQDAPTERQSAGGKGKPKPYRFSTTIKEDNARKVFSLLTAQGYINNDTQPCKWLWICGIDTNIESNKKQIDWIKGQNELVYFVERMFGEENENDLWAIASRVFTIKGKAQSGGNLRAANSKVSIKQDKKEKLDKILRHR